ncbi:3-oxo-behenoyl-CoA reductase [Aureococcus anophagefferens]|nr:3-oxo-behenoyl-CoA reductase [Aureococcus anophagefferens]
MAAIIAGCGGATGAALARRFAREGLKVYGARRRPPARLLRRRLPRRGRRPLVASVPEPVEVAVHNIGGNVRVPVAETTARVYTKVWELCAVRSTSPRPPSRHGRAGRGTVIFTGATASTRGGAGFAAFASAMAAKRALAQSLAEVGPGRPRASVIVDGGIDTAFVRDLVGEAAYADLKGRDGLLDPDAIADAYWALHAQRRRAWTHELDLRPYCETW